MTSLCYYFIVYYSLLLFWCENEPRYRIIKRKSFDKYCSQHIINERSCLLVSISTLVTPLSPSVIPMANEKNFQPMMIDQYPLRRLRYTHEWLASVIPSCRQNYFGSAPRRYCTLSRILPLFRWNYDRGVAEEILVTGVIRHRLLSSNLILVPQWQQ